MSQINWLDEVELEELTEFLTVATNEAEGETSERFKITDTSSMNWTLRKLKALDKAQNDDLSVYAEEVARLGAWLNKQSEKAQQSKDYLTGLVEQYAREQSKADAEWKGVKSPFGKVTYKTPKDKINYGDENKLVEYLETNGFLQLIKTVKTPIKDDLKKLFPINGSNLINTETGELIPEISMVKQEPVLKIVLEG